jgi:hypothetical protein
MDGSFLLVTIINQYREYCTWRQRPFDPQPTRSWYACRMEKNIWRNLQKRLKSRSHKPKYEQQGNSIGKSCRKTIHGIYKPFHQIKIRRDTSIPLFRLPRRYRSEESELEKCAKESVLHSSHRLRLFDINAVTPKELKSRIDWELYS